MEGGGEELPAARVLEKGLAPKGTGFRASLRRGMDDLANRARLIVDMVAAAIAEFSSKSKGQQAELLSSGCVGGPGGSARGRGRWAAGCLRRTERARKVAQHRRQL